MKDETIASTESDIIEEFSWFETWEEKYEYIIELGKKLPPLAEHHKMEQNRIKGCQSTVWLVANYQNGLVFYEADSDSVIVKGLISMLIRVLSGHSPNDILQARLDFISEIGMMTHLAQTRSNGLLSMIKQIKNYALAFKTMQVAEKI